MDVLHFDWWKIDTNPIRNGFTNSQVQANIGIVWMFHIKPWNMRGLMTTTCCHDCKIKIAFCQDIIQLLLTVIGASL